MIAPGRTGMNSIVPMAVIGNFRLPECNKARLSGEGRALRDRRGAYFTSTARLSAIFCFQICGPVMCTDSPLASTATVTGMSLTSNS